MMNELPGIVELVGAGPGDPGLITRRGAHALSLAQVVVYDHLVHPRLLDLAPRSALRIFAGKQAGRCVLKQPEINDLLVLHARQGKRVVRLKGGDPYVFGRGAEEAEHLRRSGIPFRVVPGVTAAVGVTSYAGVPITHRDSASAVAFVTGHDESGSAPSRLDWSAIARFPGTIVVYMGVGRLKSLCERLIHEGKAASTPAALIQHGTLACQRFVEAPLSDLAAKVALAGLGPPGLLVVGDVVSHRPLLDWYEQLPLFGQRIVVTRPADEADRSAVELEALGAEVLLAPMVEIRPLDDYRVLDETLQRLGEFDWLVFTSPNGVRHLVQRLECLGRDLRALGHLRLAAIGPATAETLAQLHLKADVVPDSYRSEALAAALAPRVSGHRVLLARADRGRTILKDDLDPIAHVEQVAVYRNVDTESLPEDILRRIVEGSIDWITLTSSAITERLHGLLPMDVRSTIAATAQLVSLSPVTTQTAAQLGWQVSVEADVYTWEGLVASLTRAVVAQRNSR
jgi:uroporphyrinogen III methyltransferase / synthase